MGKYKNALKILERNLHTEDESPWSCSGNTFSCEDCYGNKTPMCNDAPTKPWKVAREFFSLKIQEHEKKKSWGIRMVKLVRGILDSGSVDREAALVLLNEWEACNNK